MSINYNSNNFLANLDTVISDILAESEINKIEVPKSSFLSDEQINEHYQGHYINYIENFKKIQSKLKSSHYNSDNIKSLLTQWNFNYNGLMLHELYFNTIIKTKQNDDLKQTISKHFGSVEKFEHLFELALHSSNNGWVLLVYNISTKSINITIIDNHTIHCPLAIPIVAIDTWEHAYYIDYRSDKNKYVKDVLKNMNWEFINNRINDIKSF